MPSVRRPVLVVTRSHAVLVLNATLVAPVTTKVRHVSTERLLGEETGLPRASVASFDNLRRVRPGVHARRSAARSPRFYALTAKVGVKELRENLASWLDRVEAGEEVVVTDRGRAKARLVPATAQATLARLASEGAVTLPTRSKRRKLPPPIPVEGSPVTDIILRDRGVEP